MATPTIEAISTQDITIDTDYALEIGITNDPEEVTVGGLLEGFYYSWDAANNTLTIAGEATRLLGDAMWVVSAKETSSSTAVTREIIYNVVSGAPIIQETGAITVYKGVETNVFVEIQNKPTQIRSDGLLLGLKSEIESIPSEDEDEDADPTEGVRIAGMIPSDAELTVSSENANINTSNDGGEDSYTIPVTISSQTPPDMSTVSVTTSTAQATFTWAAVTNAISYAYRIEGVTEDDVWIDVGNVTEHTVTDLGSGDTYAFEWRVNSPWIGDPVEVDVTVALLIGVVDNNGDNFFGYTIVETDTFDAPTVAQRARIAFSGQLRGPTGVTNVDNGRIAVTDADNDTIEIYNVPTSTTTQSGAGIKEIELPTRFTMGSSTPQGVAYLGGDRVAVAVYLSSAISFIGVSIFSIAGDDGTQPAEEKFIQSPNGIYGLVGITYLGDNRKVAVLNSVPGFDPSDRSVSIFSIAGDDGTVAIEEKNIPVPTTGMDSGTLHGITYIGEDKVAIVAVSTSASFDNFLVISIAGDDGDTPSQLIRARIGSGIRAIGVTQLDSLP